jgi:hypothetical protein
MQICLNSRQTEATSAASQYDAFEHLRRSLFKEPDDLMAMLTAYFDDSGTSPSNRVAVVARYVATVFQWERFVPEWNRALAKGNVKVMHRADLESSYGEFRGWDKERRIAFLNRVHAVIRHRT